MLGHLLVADMDAERVEATKGTLVRTTIHHVSLALSHTLATCAMALAYVYNRNSAVFKFKAPYACKGTASRLTEAAPRRRHRPPTA